MPYACWQDARAIFTQLRDMNLDGRVYVERTFCEDPYAPNRQVSDAPKGNISLANRKFDGRFISKKSPPQSAFRGA
jgi:hypothetical protein